MDSIAILLCGQENKPKQFKHKKVMFVEDNVGKNNRSSIPIP